MPGPRSLRWCAVAIALCASSSLAGFAATSAAAAGRQEAKDRAAGPEGIVAAAGELVNVRTGKELWGREQAVQVPIASLTKVMTALVVIRAGDLRRRITISQAEVNYVETYGASNAGLHAGDILSARNLLYAMLLPSGADAAMALALSYGPGIGRFVGKMNALARRLHMTQTHFTNFDGLQSTDVSTPGNLLRLGQAAMREANFRAVVRRRWYTVKAWPHRHYYHWVNTNLLLRRYPGVIGIKTGWTPAAGECLLFEAVHGKKTLIGVVMNTSPTNSGESFVSSAELLNWAFGLHEPIPAPTPPPVSSRFALGS
jgi:D-alanyl-D-alanine carboxypeptidase (penicillin-binding protein 5/6)